MAYQPTENSVLSTTAIHMDSKKELFNLKQDEDDLSTESNDIKKEQDMTALPMDYEPSDKDVICSWARRNHKHSGNIRFRILVTQYAPLYLNADTKYEKTRVIADLIEKIRRDSPDGGFVKKDYGSGRWFEIGSERARDKVGHAIRKAADKLVKKKGHAMGWMSKEAKKNYISPAVETAMSSYKVSTPDDDASSTIDDDTPLPIDTEISFPDSFSLPNTFFQLEQHIVPHDWPSRIQSESPNQLQTLERYGGAGAMDHITLSQHHLRTSQHFSTMQRQNIPCSRVVSETAVNQPTNVCDAAEDLLEEMLRPISASIFSSF